MDGGSTDSRHILIPLKLLILTFQKIWSYQKGKKKPYEIGGGDEFITQGPG